MSRNINFASLMVFVFFLAIAPMTSADTIDQSFFSPCFCFQGLGLVAQTYTAGITGTLSGINLYFSGPCSICGEGGNKPISINTVSGGVPTSTVLGSTVVPVSQGQIIPFSMLITFPTAIPQVAGVQYAIVIDFAAAGGSNVTGVFDNTGYAAGGLFQSFDGGQTWSSNPEFDISFQTNVNPVPEPQVQIDIKPGSDPNSINPSSNGVVPVAILTTGTFDATTVDPLSVQFGPNGATEFHGTGHIQDADGDGDMDLVLHFRTRDTGIQCGDTDASLTGQTLGGEAIAGTDAIRTVGCN